MELLLALAGIIGVWIAIRRVFNMWMVRNAGACAKSRHGYHFWKYGWNWNSYKRSKFTGDYISRRGYRCYDCGDMKWDLTDNEFADQIKEVVA